MAGSRALTAREREVLLWTSRGLSNRGIAARLNVTDKTVEFHLTNIYGKLGVRNRTQAVVHGFTRELIPMEALPGPPRAGSRLA